MKYYAILGERLKTGNQMTTILKSRLQKCLKLYQVGDKVIVCGGNVCGRPRCQHSEAYIMRKYLVSKGVSFEDIIVENRSTSTIQNIRYLKKICDRRKINHITIISSCWHLPRVKLICLKYITPDIKLQFKGTLEPIPDKRRENEKMYISTFLLGSH